MQPLYLPLIAVPFFIGCTNSDTKETSNINTKQQTAIQEDIFSTAMADMYGHFNTRHTAGSMLSGNLSDTGSAIMYGDWYIKTHNNEKGNLRIKNPQQTRVKNIHTIFISYHRETGLTRITNYRGHATIYNGSKKITLQPNETLVFGNNRKTRKFYNEAAGGDTLWLTSNQLTFTNLEFPIILQRLVHAYKHKVKFEYMPEIELHGRHDCNKSLAAELKYMNKICDGNLFYEIKGNTVIVKKSAGP